MSISYKKHQELNQVRRVEENSTRKRQVKQKKLG